MKMRQDFNGCCENLEQKPQMDYMSVSNCFDEHNNNENSVEYLTTPHHIKY